MDADESKQWGGVVSLEAAEWNMMFGEGEEGLNGYVWCMSGRVFVSYRSRVEDEVKKAKGYKASRKVKLSH